MEALGLGALTLCTPRSCGDSWVSRKKDGRFLTISWPAVRAAATCWWKDQRVAYLEHQIVVCGRFELDFEAPFDHHEYIRLIGRKPIRSEEHTSELQSP